MPRKASRKASRKGSAQLKGNELMQAERRGSVVAAEIAVEGFLEKKAATLTGAEKYQSRYFVLAGHYLRYYADRQSAAEGKPKGMFDINAMQIEPQIDADPRIFHIIFPGGTSSLRAKSEENAQMWMEHMRAAAGTNKDSTAGEVNAVKKEVAPAAPGISHTRMEKFAYFF